MYGIIYVVMNKTNGKAYVGQTTGSLAIRKSKHYYRTKECKLNHHFYNALRKYKKAVWEWVIVAKCDSKEELDREEIAYIQFYGGLGYNMREGGAHGKFSEEACKKVSEAKEGKKLSKEHCDDISKTLRGKKKSKKHCRNISKAMKGKNMGVKRYNAKAVICIETSRVYGAIHEAARETGMSFGNISKVLNGKTKTAGGFHWKFV